MNYSLIEQDLEETPEGEVYFIFRKDKPRKCKIGKSIDSSKRVKGLQTGNHHELYIYKTLLGYDRLESMLHEYFNEQRIRKTEWFDIEINDVDEVIKLYNELKNAKDEFEKTDNIIDDEQISENEELEIKDNITDDEIELIEETKTEIISKKIYKLKKEEKPFICNKCNKGFAEDKYLQRHQKRKTPCTAEHKCLKCNKVFKTNALLLRHLNRQTSCVIEEIPVVTNNNTENRCHMCGNYYSNKQNLNRHLKTCILNLRPLIEGQQKHINRILDSQQQLMEYLTILNQLSLKKQ